MASRFEAAALRVFAGAMRGDSSVLGVVPACAPATTLRSVGSGGSSGGPLGGVAGLGGEGGLWAPSSSLLSRAGRGDDGDAPPPSCAPGDSVRRRGCFRRGPLGRPPLDGKLTASGLRPPIGDPLLADRWTSAPAAIRRAWRSARRAAAASRCVASVALPSASSEAAAARAAFTTEGGGRLRFAPTLRSTAGPCERVCAPRRWSARAPPCVLGKGRLPITPFRRENALLLAGGICGRTHDTESHASDLCTRRGARVRAS